MSVIHGNPPQGVASKKKLKDAITLLNSLVAGPTFTGPITLANGWQIIDTAAGLFLRPPGGTGSTDQQIGTA